MANVNIQIDGTTYSVVAGLITVKGLINLCINPGQYQGNDLHALTVLTDTGGTAPSFLDVKNNTVQGQWLINVRGGEVYASGAGIAGAGATAQSQNG